MYISKLIIENYKCFGGRFILKLNEHLNILVGDNEVGKSTIIETINLVLTGLIDGKYLKSELNRYLFNLDIILEFQETLKKAVDKASSKPPEILIEVYFEDIKDDSVKAFFEGNCNSEKRKACGIQFKIAFNDDYKSLYEKLVESGDFSSIPIEFYDFHWNSFARDETITPFKIPLKSAFIDSSVSKYKNGSDIYISRILRDYLSDEQKNAVSQAYRKLRDVFEQDKSIEDINKEIKEAINISDKEVELSLDVSSKNAWETTLTTYLDKIPFHYVGQGEQTLVKTKLALSHKNAIESNILLIEEPENHLSYSKLNNLINFIKNSNPDKQIIVSTHNSFVANKLGLGNLILFSLDKNLKTRKNLPFNDLSNETKEFFEKLSGYDTLRLILCNKVVLVEGDSDELIFNKAYLLNRKNLPIEDEIEVISVGTSFLRFLEIAEKLKKQVAVVTDNDGEIELLKKKYKNYLGKKEEQNITIFFEDKIRVGNLRIGNDEKPFNFNTLEPILAEANGLVKMNKILKKTYVDINELHKYMRLNKTECALNIFKSTEKIVFPKYILEAINFIIDEK